MAIQHDPSKCPFCGDLKEVASGGSGWLLGPIELHLLAKVAELENRLQQMEWRNMTINLGSGTNVHFDDPDDVIGKIAQRFTECQQELDQKKKPWEPKGKVECEICWSEEGSEACLRFAHQAWKNRIYDGSSPAKNPLTVHKHDFQACGSDEQQCDSACRATHRCSACGKSRSELAKDVAGVRQHVLTSTKNIVQQLEKVENLRILTDIVDVLATYSKELDWLSREQLVEMAVWEEKRETLR